MPRPRLFISSIALSIIAQSAHLYAQDVQVDNENGLLSIQASNASAQQLAEALTDQLGISVVVTGDTETLINIEIVEEPFDKALTKLSPNNMLVRAGKAADSEIIEVVLLLGEGSQEAGGNAEQFLPSGSPAEEIPLDSGADNTQGGDAAVLRDPNRAQQARSAAGAAANDAGIATSQPAVDDASGTAVDPATGLPLQPQQQ